MVDKNNKEKQNKEAKGRKDTSKSDIKTDIKSDLKGSVPVLDIHESIEEVFRDVALIDTKEDITGLIKILVRQVNALKSDLSCEELAELVFQNMMPVSRDQVLKGLLAEIFKKQAKTRVVSTRNMDALSPDVEKGAFPYLYNYDDDLYKEELYGLQVELLKLQRHVKEHGLKVMVIFEGRDAAGKGSTISRFTKNLNPRGARVVALPKPTEQQAGQWYFQRYVEQLPSPGEIVFFDRSWYNRAVVEPVMGFCRHEDTQLFLNEVTNFERSLVDHGIYLTKFWIDVSRSEQKRRFKQRRVDPVRRWKLSPVDLASLDRWDDYTVAIREMFLRTESAFAPWTIIRSDDKRRSRLNAIRVFLHGIEYAEKDEEQIGSVDHRIVKSVPEYLRGYTMG